MTGMGTIRVESSPQAWLRCWRRLSGSAADEVESLSAVAARRAVRRRCVRRICAAGAVAGGGVLVASGGSCSRQEIHKQRLAGWPDHYPWIDQLGGLHYFQSRVSLVRVGTSSSGWR